MGYKIGDIAKILNLSKQMIRYYEQKGVINPKRLEENNYRVYDVLDYFDLAEAISLSRFNVNIKDINSLKESDYSAELSKCYKDYINETNKELFYKQLLKTRAEELLNRIENAELNVGNIWIKTIPAHRLYPLVLSHDDIYGQIDTPLEVRSILNSSEILPFGDGVFEVNNSHGRWWLSFKEAYVKGLNLPNCEESIDVEDQYCVSVTMNMGDVGEFKTNMIQEKISEIYKMDYEFIHNPKSLLLCRGSKNSKFRRLLELQVPIEKH